MHIGISAEIEPDEHRVAVTPVGAEAFRCPRARGLRRAKAGVGRAIFVGGRQPDRAPDRAVRTRPPPADNGRTAAPTLA